MKQLYVFLSLTFSLLLISCTSSVKFIDEAEVLYNNRQYDKALDVLRDSVNQTTPPNEKGLILTGLSYYNLNSIRDARECFTTVLQLNPQNKVAKLYSLLCNFSYEEEMEKQSLKHEGILMDVFYQDNLSKDGVYIRAKNENFTINSLTEFYDKENPGEISHEVLNFRGLLKMINLFEDGEFNFNAAFVKSALDDFNKAIEHNASFAPAYKNKADAEYLLSFYVGDKKFETNTDYTERDSATGSENYKKAISLDINFAEAYFNYGFVLTIDRNKNGCDYLIQALQRGIDRADIYLKSDRCR